MKQWWRLIGFVLLTSVLTGSAFTVAAEQCEIPRPITADFLLSLQEIPLSPEEGGGGDPCYWQVVAIGLPVIPELLELVDDPTITRHLVPHVGGSYAVGDIALGLISDIIKLPVVDLLPDVDPDKLKTCGLCVYWDFVRESPAHRRVLRTIIEDWFSENQAKLQWVDITGIQAGGWYVIEPVGDQ